MTYRRHLTASVWIEHACRTRCTFVGAGFDSTVVFIGTRKGFDCVYVLSSRCDELVRTRTAGIAPSAEKLLTGTAAYDVCLVESEKFVKGACLEEQSFNLKNRTSAVKGRFRRIHMISVKSGFQIGSNYGCWW